MRNGAGTDLCESSDSKMPSQLSNISAIGRRVKAKTKEQEKIFVWEQVRESRERGAVMGNW